MAGKARYSFWTVGDWSQIDQIGLRDRYLPLLFLLPPPSPMFSLSQVEQALRTGDVGDTFDDSASSPPSPPSSPARRGIESIIDGLNGLDPACDKPQLMADLMDLLNYPTPETEGLTPLHWLGLNPLVILGAPAGHFGPSSPPPPPS
ncbi:hypothetical protein EDB84DRAFT_1560685 [Lactarius hengduanensis]|nr:hypothetical protein EDB84DRAFT_1560685 [Lactarius hengduanensis]